MRKECRRRCIQFFALIACICMCGRPGDDHEHGANDSLLYHSLFGRFMGNTVRMRPRDAQGNVRGEYDVGQVQRNPDGTKQHGNVRARTPATLPNRIYTLQLFVCMHASFCQRELKLACICYMRGYSSQSGAGGRWQPGLHNADMARGPAPCNAQMMDTRVIADIWLEEEARKAAEAAKQPAEAAQQKQRQGGEGIASPDERSAAGGKRITVRLAAAGGGAGSEEDTLRVQGQGYAASTGEKTGGEPGGADSADDDGKGFYAAGGGEELVVNPGTGIEVPWALSPAVHAQLRCAYGRPTTPALLCGLGRLQ